MTSLCVVYHTRRVLNIDSLLLSVIKGLLPLPVPPFKFTGARHTSARDRVLHRLKRPAWGGVLTATTHLCPVLVRAVRRGRTRDPRPAQRAAEGSTMISTHDVISMRHPVKHHVIGAATAADAALA